MSHDPLAWKNEPVDEKALYQALDRYIPIWRVGKLRVPDATNRAAVECFMKAHQPLRNSWTVAIATALHHLNTTGMITYK